MPLIPFVDLKASYSLIKEEIVSELNHAIDQTRFIEGASVHAFEEAFASYCGVQHCVAVSSGTSALYLILRAHNVGPGDEVIIPVNTFIATAEAVSLVGATPVFVDIDPSTYLIEVSSVESVITEKTKAIIPVHLYGQCADMDAICSIADRHDIIVIEDACQAHGAQYKNKQAGSLAHAAAFSFYPGKNLGAWGEGGAITTNDDVFAQTLRELKKHGEIQKYHHKRVGGNFRMSEFQGIVLRAKLPYLNQWNEARNKNARIYLQSLGDADIILPNVAEHNMSVWHLFVVQVADRDAIKENLAEQGIASGIHYPIPLHLTEAYAPLGYVKGDFPSAEQVQENILSLPMYPELTSDQINQITETLKSML